jgi:hypothetical protein
LEKRPTRPAEVDKESLMDVEEYPIESCRLKKNKKLAKAIKGLWRLTQLINNLINILRKGQ